MKGFRMFYLIGFLLVLLFLPLISAEIPTTLDIPNSAPVLIELIPNQSWSGSNISDVFDLDDYFEDLQGDTLNYTYSAVQNLSVLIDENNSVSFFPDEGFIGLVNITFYCSDGSLVTPSNVVSLFIGIDNIPPKWSNPSKNRLSIFQNDYVEFRTHWTDNFDLNQYILSINQGSGWVNYSRSFSGISADAVYNIQISASAGNIVYWRFYATDTSDNLNFTAIYDFTVLEDVVSPPGDDGSSSSSSGSGSGGSSTLKKIYLEVEKKIFGPSEENFTVSVDSFLVLLKQGLSKTLVFEITNVGDTTLPFNLQLKDLDELVFLSEKDFILEPGQSKTILVDFRAELDTPVGEYFGNLIIESNSIKTIPISFYVNLAKLEFDLSVSILEKNKNVKPGKEVIANISLVNLKDIIQSNVKFYYAIKDFQGEVYNSFEEVLVLDGALNFEKRLEVPVNTELGPYILYVRASNEKVFDIGADKFIVGSKFQFQAFLKSSIVFLIILFLSVILFFLVLRYRRQKEKERALGLYVKLNEMKGYIKDKDYNAASNIYISIKNIYGDPISPDVLKDKTSLIEDMKRLSEKIDFEEIEKVVNESEKKTEDGKKLEKGNVPDEEKKEEIVDKSVEEKKLDKKPKNQKTKHPVIKQKKIRKDLNSLSDKQKNNVTKKIINKSIYDSLKNKLNKNLQEKNDK